MNEKRPNAKLTPSDIKRIHANRVARWRRRFIPQFSMWQFYKAVTIGCVLLGVLCLCIVSIPYRKKPTVSFGTDSDVARCSEIVYRASGTTTIRGSYAVDNEKWELAYFVLVKHDKSYTSGRLGTGLSLHADTISDMRVRTELNVTVGDVVLTYKYDQTTRIEEFEMDGQTYQLADGRLFFVDIRSGKHSVRQVEFTPPSVPPNSETDEQAIKISDKLIEAAYRAVE